MFRLTKFFLLLAGACLCLVAADDMDSNDTATTDSGRQLQQRLPCQKSLFGRDIITGNCIPSGQRNGNNRLGTRQGGRFWFRRRRRRPAGQRNSRRRRMMRMSRQGYRNGRGGSRCQGLLCPVNYGNRDSAPDCSSAPTRSPTSGRSMPVTSPPTYMPSSAPTKRPTAAPVAPRTQAPSYAPTQAPTLAPSARPSVQSRARITARPTGAPSRYPTPSPSVAPTKSPTRIPTQAPSARPSIQARARVTASPTGAPSRSPSSSPSMARTTSPTRAPTRAPTRLPTRSPTRVRTPAPSTMPSSAPSYAPSAKPSPLSRSGPVVCCADAANNYYGSFTGDVVPQDTDAFGAFNVTIDYSANGITWQSSTGCGNSNPDSNIDLVIHRGLLSWTQVMDYGFTAGGFCNSNLTTNLVQGVDFWQLVGLDQGKRIMLGQLNFTCL